MKEGWSVCSSQCKILLTAHIIPVLTLWRWSPKLAIHVALLHSITEQHLNPPGKKGEQTKECEQGTVSSQKMSHRWTDCTVGWVWHHKAKSRHSSFVSPNWCVVLHLQLVQRSLGAEAVVARRPPRARPRRRHGALNPRRPLRGGRPGGPGEAHVAGDGGDGRHGRDR